MPRVGRHLRGRLPAAAYAVVVVLVGVGAILCAGRLLGFESRCTEKPGGKDRDERHKHPVQCEGIARVTADMLEGSGEAVVTRERIASAVQIRLMRRGASGRREVCVCRWRSDHSARGEGAASGRGHTRRHLVRRRHSGRTKKPGFVSLQNRSHRVRVADTLSARKRGVQTRPTRTCGRPDMSR